MDRAVALEHIDFNPAGEAVNAALAKQRRVKRPPPRPALPAAACGAPGCPGVHCQSQW